MILWLTSLCCCCLWMICSWCSVISANQLTHKNFLCFTKIHLQKLMSKELLVDETMVHQCYQGCPINKLSRLPAANTAPMHDQQNHQIGKQQWSSMICSLLCKSFSYQFLLFLIKCFISQNGAIKQVWCSNWGTSCIVLQAVNSVVHKSAAFPVSSVLLTSRHRPIVT